MSLAEVKTKILCPAVIISKGSLILLKYFLYVVSVARLLFKIDSYRAYCKRLEKFLENSIA